MESYLLICYKLQSNDFLEANRLPRNKCFSLLMLGLLDNSFGATFHLIHLCSQYFSISALKKQRLIIVPFVRFS